MNGSSANRFVVLLGLMGVGKSTVGRELATELGWPLSDSDERLQASRGQTARELEQAIGADALHELEAAHLLGALAGEPPAVICAAASTIEDGRCREALAAPGVFAVWLRASPRRLGERFDRGPHRPSYGERPAEFLAAQLRAREPLFRSIAALSLDTTGVTPAQLAHRIAADLRSG